MSTRPPIDRSLDHLERIGCVLFLVLGVIVIATLAFAPVLII